MADTDEIELVDVVDEGTEIHVFLTNAKSFEIPIELANVYVMSMETPTLLKEFISAYSPKLRRQILRKILTIIEKREKINK